MKNQLFIILLAIIFFANTDNSSAQEVTFSKDGVERTDYGSVFSTYDPFTDELVIRAKYLDVELELNDSVLLRMSPLFIGTQECDRGDCGDFGVFVTSEDTSIINLFGLRDKDSRFELSDYPALFGDYRDEISIQAFDSKKRGDIIIDGVIYRSGLNFILNGNQVDKLIASESTKVRVNGRIILFGEEIKSYFIEIKKILNEMRASNKNESEVPMAPYELKWEGNIERDPIVQPLPKNTAKTEAVISVRFQVKPDGSVGMIIPLKKMEPELEKEVQKTLRSWVFTKLPSGTPQQAQWGTVTFRFVY